MIPKSLKISGLYSYQSEQFIDFNALTSASLFGIFGAVGSGKSSILEAITFALYGDTERLNKSGDERGYNMMNLQSSELFIDFECVAGREGHRYRFTVRGKRSSKHFKQVGTFERKVYQWIADGWLPLSTDEVAEKIIGLSYDNFRRTIIIPQGRFQEFIELKSRERTDMMKELFRLERFDLAGRVKGLSGKNALLLENIEGQLKGLGEATPERLEQFQHNLRLLNQELSRLLQEQKEALEAEKTLQERKKMAETIEGLQQTQQELLTREALMKEREQRLSRYESCERTFRAPLDQLTQLRNRRADFEKKRLDQAQQLDQLRPKRQELVERQEVLRPNYEQRENLLREAEELDTLTKIADGKVEQRKKAGSLARGQVRQQQAEAALTQLTEARKALEEQLLTLKVQLPDWQEMTAIRDWFKELSVRTHTRESLRKEADALQKNTEILAQKQTEFLLLLTQQYGLVVPGDANEEAMEALFEQYEQETNRKIQQQEARIRELLIQQQLQAYADHLHEGEPCPLCGSVEHPAPRASTDSTLSERIALAERELESLKAGIEQLGKQVKAPLQKNQAQQAALEQQKAELKVRWEQAKRAIQEHQEAFGWPSVAADDPEAFRLRYEQAEQDRRTIEALEKQLAVQIKQLEEENQKKQKEIDEPLQKLERDLEGLTISLGTLRTQLKRLNPADWEAHDPAALRKEAEHRRETHRQLGYEMEKLDQALRQLEAELNGLEGSQKTVEEELEKAQKQLDEQQSTLANALRQASIATEAEVREILAQTLDVAKERQQLVAFRQQMEQTVQQLASLKADYEKFPYAPEQHIQLQQHLRQLDEQLTKARQDEGGLKKEIDKEEKDLKQKKALLEEQRSLQLRDEHLKELAKLFRSSGFVDYVSSIYLQNLCSAANERFHRMTHQQLHLELGEDNSFQVRDMLNGGYQRLLKTLSGGQKFQAALSLALALADSIHAQQQSTHNFFFLDEGFGSLDKESLRTVFETLKSLRKENRIVGVISHVEELQHEIPSSLRIELTEKGSRVVTL